MIECTNCGFLNEDDDHFCGGCREPLQWTGRRIDEQPEEVVADEPDEPEARRGVVERVVDRLTGAEGEAAESTSPDGQAAVGEVTEATAEIADREDAAAALAAEAVARAEREAAEAERLQQEAEAQAREQTEATERARAQAEEARQAREEAEARAREEAAEADRIRAELEAARASRQQAEDELRREVEEAEHAKAETRLQAEREAMERAQAELERAEAARREAEARAQAEAAAAETAAKQAAEAEQARLAAEAKAKADAEAAAQARRAAALVARPKPKPEPKSKQPEPKEPGPKQKTTEKPTTSGPTPVKPDVTRVRKTPPRTREATRRLRPGDLVCGQCGEGNTPTRNFCRRCGNTLAEAEVVKRPWWKRWIPRRKPRVVQAGERPGRGGSKGGTRGVKGAVRGAQGVKRKVMAPIGKITRVLMLVGFAAAAVGLTFNPSLRSSVMGPAGDLWDRVRGVVAPQFDPVTPIAVQASSARADQADGFCCAADNVLQFGNTWWHASEGGVGQTLTIILDTPTNIAKFGIIPGAGDPAVWPEHPRPRDLEVDFLDESGRTVATLDLTDIKDEHESTSQIFDVSGADDVTRIRVTITRVYGEGLDSDDVAISEIRLLTRR